MKASELRKIIERMRSGYEQTETSLLKHRDKTNTGITVAECEARGGYNACNCILSLMDDLIYKVELDK